MKRTVAKSTVIPICPFASKYKPPIPLSPSFFCIPSIDFNCLPLSHVYPTHRLLNDSINQTCSHVSQSLWAFDFGTAKVTLRAGVNRGSPQKSHPTISHQYIELREE